MAEWIALDVNTHKALREALGPYGVVGTAEGSALQSAMKSEKESVILLPANDEGYARLVTVRRPEKRALPKNSEERALNDSTEEYEATGFLGLVDRLPGEAEPAGQKKSWWKKLIE